MTSSVSGEKYFLESLGMWAILGCTKCSLAKQQRSTGQKDILVTFLQSFVNMPLHACTSRSYSPVSFSVDSVKCKVSELAKSDDFLAFCLLGFFLKDLIHCEAKSFILK